MKPMLASDAKALTFPLYASPKLDGIRAVIRDGMVLSRSLKPIPNEYIQALFGIEPFNGLDGELCVGEPTAKDLMQRTTSGVMSREGRPQVTYWIFDFWTAPKTPFSERYQIMTRAERDGMFEGQEMVKLLHQSVIHSEIELKAYERTALEYGYEGVMLRKPDGLYKYGRSTAREGHLLKLKRFTDAEAVVIGFEPLMHNENQATVNELGYTERSTAKDGLVERPMLGKLLVRDKTTKIEFAVGSGFTHAQRSKFWEERAVLIGRVITYKHFDVTGVKEKPRTPIFKSFRSSIDG